MTTITSADSSQPRLAVARLTIPVVRDVAVVQSPHPHAERPAGWRLPLLDRYVLRYFCVGYATCFVSLLALYVVIDFFTKSDEFATNVSGSWELSQHVGAYYLARLPWFFLRLSGIMTLLAAVFTVSWLERQNEVVAWLAAGIPARRLLRPICCAAMAMVLLTVLNREFVIPLCSEPLQRSADDPRGDKLRLVQGGYDKHGILFEGGAADPTQGLVSGARLTLPPDGTGDLVHLHCASLQHRAARGYDDNGWFILGTSETDVDFRHPAIDYLSPGNYFLHTDMTFERLSRPPSWFHYEPTWKLIGLTKADEPLLRRAELIGLLHRRLTGPLLDLLLVALGLLMLRVGQAGPGIYVKIGGCLFLFAAFQIMQFASQSLGRQEFVDPALAAWLPALVFGPLTAAYADSLRH